MPLDIFLTVTWIDIYFLPRSIECRAVYSRDKGVCLAVCPSVCQTRRLWQNGRKICANFYTIRKII